MRISRIIAWAFYFAVLTLLGVTLNSARAQTAQTAECSHGCNFAANPIDPLTKTCLLAGVPGQSAPISKPVIPKAQVPAASRDAIMADPTCWWPLVIVPAGGPYSLTAVGRADDGRVSDPSDPLALTVLSPIQRPSLPRIVP